MNSLLPSARWHTTKILSYAGVAAITMVLIAAVAWLIVQVDPKWTVAAVAGCLAVAAMLWQRPLRLYLPLLSWCIYHVGLYRVVPALDVNAIVLGGNDSGLRLMEILLVLSLLLVVIDILRGRWQPGHELKDPILWLALISLSGLAVWSALNTLQAGDRGWSGPLRWLLFLTFVPIVMHQGWDHQHIEKHTRVFIGLAYVIYAAQWLLFVFTAEVSSHSLFVMQLAPAWILAGMALGRGRKRNILVIALFLLLPLYFGESVTALVEFAAAGVAAFLLSVRVPKPFKGFAAIAAVGVAILVIIWFQRSIARTLFTQTLYTERTIYTGPTEFLTTKLSSRTFLWEPGVRFLLAHPFAPHARASFEAFDAISGVFIDWSISTHNSYLDLLLTFSLFAVPPLMILTVRLGAMWQRALARAKALDSTWVAYTWGIFLLGLFAAFFFGPQLFLAEDAPIFFIGIGFLGALSQMKGHAA